MSELGVVIVILHENKVLLTQREDFEMWCLPGGAVDSNESLATAALREVSEETGLQIQLTHQVGLMSKPFWGRDGTHHIIFAAHPISLTLKANPQEVKAAAFFPINQLPEPLLWEHRYFIAAALSGTVGQVWVNRAKTPPYFANRAELYAWRDNSGLSREAAFQQINKEIGQQTIEVVLGSEQGQCISEAEPF
ncbi:MAG: NUDIX hydrolase [Chloroflexi bacterium]|nr:NUDIX hydrolase [Chloroflexota bacterium]MBP8059796.1 NUDIX hydrolase [Chloroflexota bacterium]